MTKAQRATRAGVGIAPIVATFPAVNVKPPTHKPVALQYPTGNSVGTQLFPAFADRLKGMIMAKAMPKK
jgi:hypothetical protein